VPHPSIHPLVPAPARYESDQALTGLVARVAAGVRVVTVLVVGAVAVGYVGPPATLRWVVPAAGVLFLWAAAFSAFALHRGMSDWLVVADAGVVASAAMLQSKLVPAEVLLDGSNWLLTLASSSVMVAQLGLGPGRGMPLRCCWRAVWPPVRCWQPRPHPGWRRGQACCFSRVP